MLQTLLTACQAFLVFLFLWGIPAWRLRNRSQLPFWICLAAVMGGYTTVLYLKPAVLPFAFPILFVWILFVFLGARGKWPRVPSLVGLGLLLASFLLFLVRWEPPGTDPVKWGSYARLIWENGQLPGNIRPLGPLENIQGINLGLPVQIALMSLGDRIPWERAVSFWECLSLLFFILSLCEFLKLWFSERASLLTSLLALGLFTNPQQFLNWGGTPTLMGMSVCGIWAFIFREKSLSLKQIIILGLATAFTAHAHPIGVYLSALILLPSLLPVFAAKRTSFSKLKSFVFVGLVGAVIFLPFLFRFESLQTSEGELQGVRELQRRMSVFIHKENFSPLYALYIQMTSYVWNTAFWISAGLLLLQLRRGIKSWMAVYLGMTLVVALLVLNVKVWWLPLSFLIYPERASTLWVLALSLPLAAFFDRAQGRREGKLLLFLLGILALGQSYRIVFPQLQRGEITASDRSLMKEIPLIVPVSDCVQVNREGGPFWVSVISFRCTFPYHPLSESIQDETREWINRPLLWHYFASSEAGLPAAGEVVKTVGEARLVRKR
jgi:hypothetical protein